MENKYKLTIIMSNYNQEKYIQQSIDSVLAQKVNFKFQLIITDDNSTKDKSIEIIKEYADKYPDVIKPLYNKENGRYLKNILRAKALTKTEYFTLLDSDDYWTDLNYLQNAVDFLDDNLEFTIYNTNVLCLNEDNSTYPYVNTNIQSKDFSLKDYFSGSIFFSQTTGMVFRNIIFKQGIPELMTNAIDSASERSFEGDADRYLMHLKYGKAHFENNISGVYRILSSGIWSRLNEFDKNLIQAQCYIDYNQYFENEYLTFFVNSTYKELKKCLSYVNNIPKATYDATISEHSKFILSNVISFCLKNKSLIKLAKPNKLKYRIYKKIYDKLSQKLSRKGLI